jgi:hypothetical protein
MTLVSNTPNALLTALNTVTAQIERLPTDKRQPFQTRDMSLKLELERYGNQYQQAQHRTRQTLGSEPELLASTRSYQQLETVLGSHQNYVESLATVDQHIRNSHKARFDVLHKHGLTEVRDSQEFYAVKAQDERLASGEASPLLPAQTRLKTAFLWISKVLVGVMSGVSLNMLFNPDGYELLTAAAMIVGVGLAVLMLDLVSSLAYRAKLATHPRYLLVLIAVVLAYSITEAWLNYDGVISVSRAMAEMTANEGQLLGESEPTSAPAHYSLLAFTLCLVWFSALFAALSGRDKALTDQYNQQNTIQAAKLRKAGKLTDDASVIDEPQFLLTVKAQIQQPAHKPLISWFVPVVRHLSKQEAQLYRKVSEIDHALSVQSGKLSSAIFALASDVHLCEIGQEKAAKKLVIPFTRNSA